MHMPIYSIKPFQGDSGLSISVVSSRDSTGTIELDDLVNSIEAFYRTTDPDTKIPNSKPAEGDSLLFRVIRQSKYVGSVKITPKGIFSKSNQRPDDDFPIADPTRYCETYWVFFYPKDKSLRRNQRDGFIEFVDPRGEKRR